jgi:sec-independent protein translocase protein TatA
MSIVIPEGGKKGNFAVYCYRAIHDGWVYVYRQDRGKAGFGMGELSPIHWLIVLVVVVLLFGGRRIPEVMRGLGEGVKSFKEGMREEPRPAQSSTVNPPAASAPPVATSTPENKIAH